MMGDKVRWCDAYKHITLGGKAQHESWQPNCFIRVDEAGEIVFDDGTRLDINQKLDGDEDITFDKLDNT